MMMRLLGVALVLSLIPIASADIYNDCDIYGTCKPSKASITFNNNTGSVNNSQFLQGQTPATLNSTFIAPIFAASLSYTNTVVNGNTTAIVAGIIANSSADRLYANTILQGNLSANASAFLSTFNATYDALPNAANQTASYVPYVGASGNVDLNGYNLTGFTSINSNSTLSRGLGSFVVGTLLNPSLSSINATNANNLVVGRIANARGYILASGQASFIKGTVNNADGRLIASSTGSTIFGVIQGDNSSILSSNLGTVAFARIGGTNSSVVSSGQGAFVHGHIGGGINNTLISNGAGAFLHGQIGSAASRSNVQASGQGAFVHGTILSSDSFIIASGTGSVAIGMANITCIGDSSTCMGNNINITGTNSFGIGLGSPTLDLVTQSRVFYIGTGAVGINTTTPQALLHVNGTSQFESNMTINNLVTLNLVTLPACNAATNGSIGRNLTGFYGCAIGDGNWVRFGA